MSQAQSAVVNIFGKSYTLSTEGQDVDYMRQIAHMVDTHMRDCLLYTSPSPRDGLLSRMPSSA